jgi:hypothetical protein
VRFDERAGIGWSTDAVTLTPIRSAPAPVLPKEVESCGRCHARRGQLSEDWVPRKSLSETHRVSLLDRQSFHSDGQMRDDEETYNYAPFKQSKMFVKGVTCSESHDPHSATLKALGALGLALVREKRSEEALDELRQAAMLDPRQSRYA